MNAYHDEKEHVSFRIEKDILDKLKFEANETSISLNTLINQVLRLYCDWYSLAPKSGTIPYLKSMIRDMIEEIDVDRLNILAKTAAVRDFKSIVLMFKNGFNIHSWIEVFDLWLRISGISHRHEIDGQSHLFTIQHGMGKKFSMFEKELLYNIFRLLDYTPSIEITESTIVLKVNLRT
ncbi:MAG: hypothetical protein ACT4N1_03275 [Nitrososphaerota archaeon]